MTSTPPDNHRSTGPATAGNGASARSPLVRPAELSAYSMAPRAPAPHTTAELAGVLALVRQLCPPPRHEARIAIGHSRDEPSRASARAFARAWTEHSAGTLVLVDWPEVAASWQRQAVHMTAQTPDAWVIAAAPLGFMQLVRRLAGQPGWSATRTVAFASLQDALLPAVVGSDVLHGLRGATTDGRTWQIRHRAVVVEPAIEQPPPLGTDPRQEIPEIPDPSTSHRP